MTHILLEQRAPITFRRIILVAALMILGGLLILPVIKSANSRPPDVVAINLVPSIRYQRMRGWEATAQAGQFHSAAWSSYKNTVLDRSVNELGVNRVRVEVPSGVENPVDYFGQWREGKISEKEYISHRYDIVNDNADPNETASSGFQWSALDGTIIEVALPLRQRLHARGETLWVNVNYVDFGSSVFEHKSSPAEYAELVLATYQHMQAAFGFVPDSWEVALEPDTSSANWSADQVAEAVKAAGDRLTAAGFSPNFVAPSTTSAANALAYIDRIAQTEGAMGYVGEFSYHRYCCASDGVLQSIAGRAVQYDKQSAMLEWIGADQETLHQDIKLGRVSSWQQYTLAFPNEPDNGAQYYLVNDTNPTAPIVTPGSRTLQLAQYFRFIRSGAERIEASTSNSDYDPLAFINTDGKYVVVVKAESGGSISLSGLPTGTYGIRYTTAADHSVDMPTVAISVGQPLTASIPESGVLTVYALGGSSPTPTVSPTPTPTPTTTSTPLPTLTPTSPSPTQVPTPGLCTPSLTVTEVFPGSLAAFSSITAGPNSVTVDIADIGPPLQGLSLISAVNASVTLPILSNVTFEPVTATFGVPDSLQPTDFTLRASARRYAVLIRARCGSGFTPTPTVTPTPETTPTLIITPTPEVTPTPTSGSCTPTLTVTEVFPGSQSAFQSITAGPGTLTVDGIDSGMGLHSFTLLSAENADVSIPLFQLGTTAPVTATFSSRVPGLPVDFSLRASQRIHAVIVRARCMGAG